MARSAQNWEAVIQQNITTGNPAIDVEFGPVYDTLVKPSGFVSQLLDARMDYIKNLTNIATWANWSDADLENYIAQYGIARRLGTYSTTLITFYTVKKPVTDINIPRNVNVSTLNGINFVTTAQINIPLANVSGYKNTTTGRYEFDCPIKSINAGAINNIAAGSIISVNTALPFISGAVNKQGAVGGSDKETNAELINRVQAKVQGGYGSLTPNSLKLFLLQNFPQFQDLVLVKSTPMITGTIDAFYIGTSLAQYTDSTYFFGFNTVLSKSPVREIISVTSGVNMYAEGIDWNFVSDTGSSKARTNAALDQIVWIGTNRPPAGSQLSINYYYNGLADQINTWQQDSFNKLAQSSIIFREAVPISIVLGAIVKVNRGYDKTQVAANVQSYSIVYVNNLGLGVNGALELSDINQSIRDNVAGINNLIFTQCSIVGGTGVNDLPGYTSSHYIIDSTTITIVAT